MLIKTREFKQNDIYFLEALSDKIIINDNYDGILILDNNLDLIKRLKIFEDITVYSSIVNNNEHEILLFCPDNECLVHINISNYEYNVIYLKSGLENLIFSALYEWNVNGLVLTTYMGEFYRIYVNEKTIEKIYYKEIERLYPKLYESYQYLKRYKVIKVFPYESVAIIDDGNHNINVLNYKDQTKHIFNNATANFLDIEFREGAFVIVNEHMIEIIINHNKKTLKPNKNYIFLKARFLSRLNDICLVTLSSSQSNVNHSKIDMFRLCTI